MKQIKNNSFHACEMTIALLFAFLSTTLTYGQQTKRGPSIEAGSGISNYGVMFYGSYVAPIGHKENSHWYLKPSVFYETGKGKNIKYNTLGMDMTAGYTILTVTPWLIVNAKIGLTINHDKLTTPLTETNAAGNTAQNDYNSVKFGVLGGAEAQLLLSQKISIVVGGDQRYLTGNETWGHVRWYANAGLRYALK